ncbi:hypothetical protein [Streptomyces sp. NPDC059256]|uniref:hypothetical protein n=1 Tax=Streptomyces sp. NPDC059256 TaxID=3346794 RepID=UPI0036922355
MNADDEQLLRGRVYGHDHDEPHSGPLPHRTYAALVGGPLGDTGRVVDDGGAGAAGREVE